MNFRVGQKVVCVEDQDCAGTGVRKGEIYTVAEKVAVYSAYWNTHTSVRLAECGVILFSIVRFRPVVERKTDISVFTKILDDVSRKVPADAVH
jgi:hypothetical protein